jgi:hypothetical protein
MAVSTENLARRYIQTLEGMDNFPQLPLYGFGAMFAIGLTCSSFIDAVRLRYRVATDPEAIPGELRGELVKPLHMARVILGQEPEPTCEQRFVDFDM